MKSDSVVVIGDGWAALAAVGFLASSGIEVRWVAGQNARMISPLSSFQTSKAAWACLELAQRLEIPLGAPEEGCWLREYRNKTFRKPPWMKSSDPAQQAEHRDAVLWAPERRIASLLSSQVSLTLGEIEESFRNALAEKGYVSLQRQEKAPVVGIEAFESAKDREDPSCVSSPCLKVSLANGEEILATQVIYADQWRSLRALKGLPQSLKFTQKREPVGAVQVVLDHRAPVGGGARENFYAALHRENGDSIERNLWGYFSTQGTRSYWTLCLSEEEVEDNHGIAKKLRRLKSSLDRMFSDPTFLPPGCQKFTDTLVSEQVRLVEEAFFSGGEMLLEPILLPSLPGVAFLTDAYGPSAAWEQVVALLGVNVQEAHLTLEGEAESLQDSVLESSSEARSESSEVSQSLSVLAGSPAPEDASAQAEGMHLSHA
ncbi:MAG: hypothetical protein ACO3A2_01680 [Bdellovibrionia bacterium]